MRRFITLLIAASTVALLVSGCGSSDDTSSGSSAGAPGTNECKGDYAAYDAAGLARAVDTAGQCAGESDRALECNNDVTKKVTTCGSDCFATGGTEVEQDACVNSCIGRATTPSLTAECIDCYVVDVACTRAHCAVTCGISPGSPDCTACRIRFGCASDFYACSGLPAPGGTADGAAGSSGSDATAGAGGT